MVEMVTAGYDQLLERVARVVNIRMTPKPMSDMASFRSSETKMMTNRYAKQMPHA